MVDGPRGVRAGTATAFPVGMARGASWDIDLERRVGAAIAMETRAKGGNVLLAPTMNLLRHPGWGRAQETYSEDSHHMARMAGAFIEGAQEHIIATAKHYAANSIENTRFDVDVTIDERTLREIYLRHFRYVVTQTRVAAVMSAYNLVNGFYCAENEHLLRDILKEEWGFEGFVMSDWLLGTRSTVPSLIAGLDVEMPAPQHYGDNLLIAVENGEADETLVDEAVTRIVGAKLAYDVGSAPGYGEEVVESDEHLALAREAAQRSITLLKNDGALLPLPTSSTIALVGALSDVANMGDEGSSAVVPSSAVTPFDGLSARATVQHVATDAPSAADETTIATADVVVVVVGLTAEDEGENLVVSGGDRSSLALRGEHIALIQQVALLNPSTVVVLEGGSAITVEDWVDDIPALLMAYYPGAQGGHAIADVLFGDVNPSGKLPFSVPIDEADLVPFIVDATAVTYDYFHGYRHLDVEGTAARYRFGFGLSYTTFAYDNLDVSGDITAQEGVATVSVDVTNTGNVAGEEVVQVFVSYDGSSVPRPPSELKAFARVALSPGETQTVELLLSGDDLAYHDGTSWVVEDIAYTVSVASLSASL